jgi:hypothetical protein
MHNKFKDSQVSGEWFALTDHQLQQAVRMLSDEIGTGMDGFRFRCYPTDDQAQTLRQWIGCQRSWLAFNS